MSLYAKSYERVLKSYDRDLFVDRNRDGVLCVFRHTKRYEPVVEAEGFRLLNLKRDREYVFALTETWGLSGKPRDWGADDVLDHVQKIDKLANADVLSAADELNDQVNERRMRHIRGEMEAFWKDQRRAFAKATDDILTHSLDKSETKRRLKDRSIKNGNR